MSLSYLGLTLHPRTEMILSPPPRILSLHVRPMHSFTFHPSIEVVAAMQLHRSVIAPTLTFTPSSLPIIHATTLASMLPYHPGDDIDVSYIILPMSAVHICAVISLSLIGD